MWLLVTYFACTSSLPILLDRLSERCEFHSQQFRTTCACTRSPRSVNLTLSNVLLRFVPRMDHMDPLKCLKESFLSLDNPPFIISVYSMTAFVFGAPYLQPSSYRMVLPDCAILHPVCFHCSHLDSALKSESCTGCAGRGISSRLKHFCCCCCNSFPGTNLP